MQTRRKFIQQSLMATGALLVSKSMLGAGLEGNDDEVTKLTILHTNDVHSRLEPFPMDGGKNQGLGGVAARAALISSIRAEEKNVLLLDAGDIFQGTPFFNIYKGEPEIKAMTAMGYDAGTMGNHDFDAGIENFANQLTHASFPILICNYDFTNTPMEFKYQPYEIFRRGKLKIGVTGVGVKLSGLVPENLYGNTKYLDPVENANRIAGKLKTEESCDLVICLSHLGYKYKEGENKIDDRQFAAASENIDLIIGGHTHTFMEEPEKIINKKGDEVIINQVGWAGIMLGRLDFEFTKKNTKTLKKSHTVAVGKKSTE